MIVVDPSLTTHTINIVPRDYDLGVSFEVYIRNETTKEENALTTTTNELNRGLEITFDFNFTDRYNYELRIVKRNDIVVYRGKIFATSQNPQDYKQTTDKYYWN